MQRSKKKDAGNEREHLYKSKRVGGKVRSQYVGRKDDPYVQYIQRLERLQVAERRASNAKLQRELQRYSEYERSFKSLLQHQGQWRLLSEICSLATRLPPDHPVMQRLHSDSDSPSSPVFEGNTMNWLEPLPSLNEFQRLRARVDAGDEPALAEFKSLLKRCPQLMHEALDMVSVAKHLFIDVTAETASQRAFLEESIDNHIAQIHQQLSHSPIGEAYATAFCIAWFDTLITQVASLRQFSKPQQTAFWRKAYERAIQRLIRMKKVLGMVQD